MRVAHLRARLADQGAKPGHIEALLRSWAHARPLEGFEPAQAPPKAVRGALPGLTFELQSLACVRAEHPSEDGSSRRLVAFADGQTVESVLLPRGGVCVSTQIGCAVGCTFCMTGQGGLLRQLGSAEIVAQVVLARQRQAVKKVVFMGMGEPAHNLDNVMDAIDLLGTEGGIAHKNLVFSTVGDLRAFERLPRGRVRPALAISLHSTLAAKRAELLPRAPRIDPAELVELGERYARATHYPIQYQWTLLEGVNDGDDELDGIARLLAGKYAVMNLIHYNAVEGLAFKRIAPERAAAIAHALYRRGVLTKLRDSAGQDVEGGCGQLRARAARPQPVMVHRRDADAGARSQAPCAPSAGD